MAFLRSFASHRPPFVAALLALALACALPRAQADDRPSARLVQPVAPRGYDLTIKPSIDFERFDGKVVIDLQVDSPVEQVTLNASRLEIQTARIDDEPAFVTADAEAQTVTLALPDPLEAGRHQVEITYEGLITGDTEGLFHLDYRENGRQRRVLATDLEPIGARRLLPCFDEPRFRAPFKLKAYVPRAFLAISNGEVVSRTVIDRDTERVEFEPSPPMSSYLLALFVGPFRVAEDSWKGVKLRVFSVAGDPERGREALVATKALLEQYTDYFGLPYPLKKLDQIALPNGDPDARENWGAVAYDSTGLLYDKTVDGPQQRTQVWKNVAHEVAHQWFGDLVTPAWWDDAWLKEAFATWLAARTVDQLQPQWGAGLEAARGIDDARNSDALGVVGPVHRPVDDDRQLSALFDDVTDQKGHAVIAMMENAAGAATFQRAIRRYVREHRYGNATTEDLLRALEVEGATGAVPTGRHWIDTPGLPLIDVARGCDRGRGALTLTQRGFRLLGAGTPPAPGWSVPVRIASGPKLETIGTFKVDDTPVVVPLPSCETPAKVNAGETGFYRTHYDPLGRTLALQGLALASDPTVDRLGLVHDTMALFWAGQAQAHDLLELVTLSQTEADPHFWNAIADAVPEVRAAYAHGAARAEWLRVRSELIAAIRTASVTPIVERPGSDVAATTARTVARRAAQYRALGLLNDPVTIRDARARFVANPRIADDAVTAEAVLGVVGRNATPAQFDALLARLMASEDPQERQRLLSAIGQVQSPVLAQRAAALVIDPGFPSTQALRLGPLLAAAGHEPMMWNYLDAHWDAFAARGSPESVARAFAGVATESFDPARADEVERIAVDRLGPVAAPFAKQAAAWSRARVQRRALAESNP